MTAPLSDRLRAAADTVEELNARDGLPVDTPVFAPYLRGEADRLDREAS